MLICLGIFMSAKTAHRASLIEWFFMVRGMRPTGLHTKTAVPTQKIYQYKSPSIEVGLDFPKLLGGIVVIIIQIQTFVQINSIISAYFR